MSEQFQTQLMSSSLAIMVFTAAMVTLTSLFVCGPCPSQQVELVEYMTGQFYMYK